tara:strand:- start:956 stop:1477 length:522 start_codon:yes stop_codon:yes gene_type:complete
LNSLLEKQITNFYRDSLGIKTNEKDIYLKAITHKSYNNISNNERLEFLGDAVLDLIVSQQLFFKNKEASEGFLSIEKSKYVSRENLNKVAERILNKNLIKHKSNYLSNNMLGNTLESIIGAIYIDKGMPTCEKFILKHILHVKEEKFYWKKIGKIINKFFNDKKTKVSRRIKC